MTPQERTRCLFLVDAIMGCDNRDDAVGLCQRALKEDREPHVLQSIQRICFIVENTKIFPLEYSKRVIFDNEIY